MKKTLVLIVLIISILLLAKPIEAKDNECTTISSGEIIDSNGNVIVEGFDKYGYNYQAHMFNGYYANYSRPETPVMEGDKLIMKWSDSWIANVDCNDDGKLDRGLVNGESTGISKGWLTNHFVGTYSDSEGTHHYTDFIKMGWVGPEEGDLWGQYTILEEVWNDPAAGLHGIYSKIANPGFGQNDQWTSLP